MSKRIIISGFYTDLFKDILNLQKKSCKDDYIYDFEYVNMDIFNKHIKNKKEWFVGNTLKSEIVVEKIKKYMDSILIIADADIVFLKQSKKQILKELKNKDMLFLKERHDLNNLYERARANVNTGFVVIRCNEKTLKFWEKIDYEVRYNNAWEQEICNEILLSIDKSMLDWAHLSNNFANGGDIRRKNIKNIIVATSCGTIAKRCNCTRIEYLKKLLLFSKFNGLIWFSKKNYKFIEKIFSAKNTPDGKHKIITVLGIKFKFRKKIKTDTTTKIIKHSSDLYFLQKSNIQAASIHPQTFLPYKGINKDKNIVIVGSGPSLSNYNFIKDYIHIGVNRAFLKKDINLDYLFIQDFLKGKDDMERANAYNPSTCTKFYGILPENRYNQYKNVLKKITNKQIVDANARPYIIEDAVCRSWANLLEIEPLGDWCGCIFSALQFALYTAPKKIYLVGCDCSDNGHFHEERAEIAMSTSLSYQYNSWHSFKKNIDRYYPNVEIISVNPVGLKGMFKDVYTQSYVNEHPELLKEDVEIINTKKHTKVSYEENNIK